MRAAKPLTPGDAFNQMRHLFGQHITNAATPPVAQVLTEKDEEHEVPQAIQNLPDGMAVWPFIDNNCFALTMDNFRLYRHNYNKWVKEENKLINKHNSEVEIVLAKEDMTETEAIMVGEFHRRYTYPDKRLKGTVRLNDRQYNEKVDLFCKDSRPLIAKRKIQTLKPQAELAFQQMLYLYSIQVNDRTERFMKHAITSQRPLQDIEIRSDEVRKLHRKNGAQSLEVVNKTVRNQRARMEEAGVFTDYVYQGSYNSVRNKINPEILVFNDLFLAKQAAAENQNVISAKRKKFPVISYDLSTQTLKNECKIKDDAAQSSCDKEFAAQTGSFHYKNIFYKNTSCKEGNSPGAGAAENVKVEKTLSEKLRDHIVHPQQLAQELAAGSHHNHIPIDIRIIWSEAHKGTLTEQEFRELMIQDFFRSASKLYRNSTPFVGSWKKAINEWMDKEWMTFNGFAFNKLSIAKEIEMYRWCIDDARKWFAKTGVTPLFPSEYFDRTRKSKGELGFLYQQQRYKRYVRGKDKKEAEQRKRERNAELRRIQGNNNKRLRTEVNRFIKGRITLPQLEKYIKDNLPAQYYADLPAYLHKRINNL